MAQAQVGQAINEQKHRPNRESARPHGHEQIMTRQRGLRWWCRLRRSGGTKGRPWRCQCADGAETRGAGRPCQMSPVPKQQSNESCPKAADALRLLTLLTLPSMTRPARGRARLAA